MSSTLGRYLAGQGIRVNDNGRPSRPGSFRDIRGVMWHHTAGNCGTGSTPGEVSFARNGGLYNLLVGADAVCYIITNQAHGQPEPGRAHHAGTGGPWQTVARDNGNAHIVGISGQCNGAHALSTHPALYRVMLETTAALCRRYNLRADQVLGHREWTSRKIDPRDDMNRVRRDVAALLAPTNPPPAPPAQRKDEGMILQAPTGSWWLLDGGRLVSLTAAAGANARAGGLPAWSVDRASWDNIVAAYAPTNRAAASAGQDS